MSIILTCPNCNKEIKEDDIYCGNCGYKLKAEKEVNYATFWLRCAERVIDHLILLIVFSPVIIYQFSILLPYYTEIARNPQQIPSLPVEFYLISNIFLIGAIIITIAYFTILTALYGQTLGKMIVGVKVVQINGEKVTWKNSFIRAIFEIIVVSLLILVCGIGLLNYVWVIFDKKKQAWHDKVASTCVIQL